MNNVYTFGVIAAMDSKAARLRDSRVKAGFRSAAEAARRLGLRPSTYAAHENGQNDFGTEEAMIYAQTFNVPWEWLLTGYGKGHEPTPALLFNRVTPNPTVKAEFRPAPEFLGERDLPVYAAVEGGKGEMVVTTDPIDMVPRPWYMGNVKDGYAVLVVGESMVPAYRPGEMAIINPRYPPMRGRDHVLVAENPDEGSFRAMIKNIQSWTEQDWQVEQYNPPSGESRLYKLPRKVWGKALRVVGKYNN